MGKKFNPNYNYKGTSDYDYDKANKIIDDPFDSSQFINNRDWVEGDPYGRTLPMLGDSSSNSSDMFVDSPKLGSDNEHAGNYSLPMPDNSWQSKYTNFQNSVDNFIKSNPITSFLAKAGQSAANVMTNGGVLQDNYDTGSKIANTAADFLGTGLGFAERLPGLDFSIGNAMNKVIGQPAENVLNDIANKYGASGKLVDYGIQAAKTGTEFGSYEGLSNAIQGKDVGEGIASGFGQGALWGAGGKALGEVFSHFVPGIGKTKVVGEEGNNVIVKDEAGNEMPMNKVIFDNTSKPIEQPMSKFDERSNINIPFENKVSEIPSMNEVAATDMPLPIGEKRGQFIDNSIRNSEVTPTEVKDFHKDNPDYYIPKNNPETWDKAQSSVNNNFANEKSKLVNQQSMESAEDTAKALAIYKKYIDDGNMSGAIEWASQISGKIRNTAQALQFMSTLKKFTPEWTLERSTRDIEKTWTAKQREIMDNAPMGQKEQVAKANNIPYMSAETSAKIAEMSAKIQDMPDGRAKREAIANLNDTIQSEIPTSILDKINSMQTISMLSGTKTPIRNIIGNTLFKTVDNLKEIPRTLIDIPLSLITGERTSTLPMIGDQLKGYKAGTKEAFLDLKNNVNTKDINDKFELNRRTTWNKEGNLFNKAMSQAERINRFALDDRPAMQAAYEGEMARLEKLAKINGVEFDKVAAKEKADLKALHDTFNDDTSISQMVTNLKRNANIVGNSVLTGNGIGKQLDQATKDEFAKFGAGDLLVKFAKVPSNIIARQIEYSPWSLVSSLGGALKDAIKKEKFDQDAFADGLAKGLTGTGIMGLGAMLHNVLTTDSDKNKNKAALDRETGLGSFKMNISALRRLLSGEDTKVQKGDNIVSYDWANPISVLLAAGASMAKAKDGKTVQKVGKIVGDLGDALNEGMNSLIDQPMNQGLKTWIQQGDMMGGLSQVIAALPQTFIPSVVNQFRQLSDNTSRETYDPNLFKQGLNQMINRVPGLEKQLPQKVGIMGNQKETFQNGSNNLLNVFLNPAIETQYLPTPQIEKAFSLFEHTANSEVLPKLVDKTLNVDNQKVKLTPEQYIQLQTLTGQGANNIYSKILNDSDTNKLAKDTAKALTGNSQDAKIKVLQDNNLPLPLSVTKDAISKDLYKNRSENAKNIRKQVKSITDSDMTLEEQKKALDDLEKRAKSTPKSSSKKSSGKKFTP